MKIRRFLFGFLAVIMLLSISACGQSTDEPSSDVPPTSNGEEETPPANEQEGDASQDDGPLTPYDPPIELEFWACIDPNDERIAELEKLTGETVDDNRWIRLFREKLGINVKYEFLAGWGQYIEKLRMAMATSDLPDFFRVLEWSDMKQLAEAGVVEEIGPLYERYATSLLRSIIEAETDRVFEPVTYDGKIYGIPFKMPSTNGYNHLWIREDWLKKLGLERPKTMNDVYNIARAFAEQDPDGNNQDDTIGLEFDNGFLWQSKGLFWAYKAYPSFWLKGSTGEIVYGSVQLEMKKALAFLNTLYNEGLIDKEFGSKDNAKAMESVVNEKCGMFYGPHWMAFTIENQVKNNPDAKWITVPLPSEDGSTVKIPLTIAADGCLAVKKGAEHPEAAVKMFNLYVEKLFGQEAEFNKYFGEEGIDNIWNMSPLFTLDPKIDLQAHLDIKKAIAEGTTDTLTGPGLGFYKNMENGMWPFSMMFGPTDTPFDYVGKTYPDEVFWNEYFGAPTPTMAERWSSLEELISTSFTKMIQGQLNTDSDFDKMVEDWMNMGGKQVTEEVNAARN